MQCISTNIYSSCSCNRNPNILTWGDNNLIYYGSCNAIAVYDPKETQRILHTCCAHKDEVRSVRWIRSRNTLAVPLLLTTSSDTTAIVWNITDDKGLSVQAVLSGHTGAVTVADGLHYETENGKNETIIATTSVDFNVKIWKSNSSDLKDFECIQTIRAGSGFCLDVKLHFLPNTNTPLLACAMDDFKIILYTWEEGSFHKKEVLVGHEDWVCCLDWVTLDDGDVMLASGSQDTYIRLWRISPSSADGYHRAPSQLDPSEDIKPEEKVFTSVGSSFALKIESILLGHSTWVHSVAWQPAASKLGDTGDNKQPLKLLSSSLDASVCVWEPDPVSGIWSPSARLGLLKEDSLGVRGCVWGPPGTPSIIAHSLQGSLHRWDQDGEIWTSGFTIGGGHFGEVLDLCWEPDGAFLLSVSADQTTRVHAPWVREGQDIKEVWHELARPQVHGYDLTCIAPVSRFSFASGAEEKIIRCFQAPTQFKHLLKNISKIKVSESELMKGSVPQAASLPVLGLSNLSVADVQEDDKALLLHGIEDTSEPLREEVLWRSTLWPEERKLYGHGYELYCLASTHSGDLLASASRATLPEHAAILVWDTKSWQEIQKLPSHQLTVTQLAFSPDDQYLLSVSRDRRLSVFKRSNESTPQFSLVFSTDKRTGIHTRIIWSCAWSSDSLYFITGSREGTVVVWGHGENNEFLDKGVLDLKTSITALAFAPSEAPYLTAIGTDEGDIFLYQWQPQEDKKSGWTLCGHLEKHVAHHKTVRRLVFRPGSRGSLQLASCGSDNAVKIFNIDLRR